MTYLITGANRGLGLELAREGARLGFDIIAACRNSGGDLDELVRQYSAQIRIISMDVASTESVESASREITGRYKSLNGFINNAAVLYGSKYDPKDPITAIDIKETGDTFNINFTGVVRVMKYFMPLVYSAEGYRCVVNITSEGAVLKETGHHYASYAASKSALNNYTQRMRNYLASQENTRDIRVYMIHPGRMHTKMGVENAQIQPSESARGIWEIITRKKDLMSSIPFFDYMGNHL
jgi:NAD(P)-dependent dehydrogenase (short-subunit alcohol dehydrogenase family)